MPTGKSWINFVYVNLGFLAYIMGIYYLSSINEIRKNWPLYRCNPLYMPLSENVQKDFNYCVQNTQMNFMGYLLQPLTFVASSVTNVTSGFLEQINLVRAMFNKIRNFLVNIVQSIFGVFFNLIIEFQKITIGIKDIIGKTIGIVVTMLYVLDGSIKTMNSTWNGPPGQMVRSLGKCFDPNTLLKLIDGSVVKMQDINLGDILENGSAVTSVMKISNKITPEYLYKIEKKGINGEDIYVTGSHLVYDSKLDKFIQVKNYCNAIKTDIKPGWFSCLITSDNRIKIGNELFWDWEDHFMKM